MQKHEYNLNFKMGVTWYRFEKDYNNHSNTMPSTAEVEVRKFPLKHKMRCNQHNYNSFTRKHTPSRMPLHRSGTL